MKFYLLRHGETEWNKLGKFQGLTDVSLNERASPRPVIPPAPLCCGITPLFMPVP